jgi:iron complex transport system substrate-binding protein
VRVVTHTCSNTEIVCALGCAEMLVGVDDHSDYPTEVVSNLPRVGPDLGIDVERVKTLEPDLVLTSLTVPGHERIVEALREAALPLMVVEPISLDDVHRDILMIAAALGVASRGRRLVEQMREQVGSIIDRGIPKPRILVEWWPKPVIVAGRHSWVTDMISAAGAVNPWADQDCKSRPVSDEEVIAAAPDAVVLSWCGIAPNRVRPEIVMRRELWRSIPAVKNGRIFCVPEAWMGRPGPRLVEGIRSLRAIVAQLDGHQRKISTVGARIG